MLALTLMSAAPRALWALVGTSCRACAGPDSRSLTHACQSAASAAGDPTGGHAEAGKQHPGHTLPQMTGPLEGDSSRFRCTSRAGRR